MDAIEDPAGEVRFRRSRARIGPGAWAQGILFGAFLILGINSQAYAAIQRDFVPRFQVNETGDIQIVGNALMSCSTETPPNTDACPDSRAGDGGRNNQFFMEYVDADGDATTFNSSAASFTLPAGAEVLWAGLYWGADTSGGGFTGVESPNPELAGQILFRSAADAYSTISAQQVDTFDTTFSAFADVTAALQTQTGGTTVEYWAANIQAGTGGNRYGGWSLVVVHTDPTQPLRNLTVFDGYADVRPGAPVNVPVSGFVTPLTGSFATLMGAVVFEGDLTLVGDLFQLNGTSLTNLQSADALTNFFNSSISRLGTRISAKNPDFINQLSFDLHVVDASGLIDNGATGATLTYTSDGDVYYPAVLTFAVEIFQPVLTVNFTKTVTDENGGDTQPGDVLVYEISAENTGNDPAVNSVATDPIPAGTTYEPGSLEIVRDDAAPGNVGLQSDAPGDDLAEFDGTSVIFRVGAGATETAGGQVNQAGFPNEGDPADIVTIRFKVRVDTDLSPLPSVVSNQAQATYTGLTSGDDFDGPSNVASIEIVQPTASDLGVLKTASPDPVAVGATLVFTVTAQNFGADPIGAEAEVQVDDPLPDGYTFVSAVSSQGGYDAGSGVWEVGTLPPGTADAPVEATLEITATVNDSGEYTNTATVSGVETEDPNPDNDTASVTPTVFVPGSDGVIDITDSSLPGEDLSVSVADSDLNVDPALAETVVVTVVNDRTGESEQLMLTETGPGTAVFSAVLPSVFGADAGVNDDGALVTSPGDTVTASYEDMLNSAGEMVIRSDTGEVIGVAGVAGNVWLDVNIDDAFDANESPLEGWIVRVLLGEDTVGETTVNADGSYLVPNVEPLPDYTIFLVSPDNGVVFRRLDDIELVLARTLTDQNLPVQPTGLIYDSVARVPLAGVRVTVDGDGRPLPAACLLPGQQGQVTGETGLYQLSVDFDADPACSPAIFQIRFDAPTAFVDAPSSLLPPLAGPFDPAGPDELAPIVALASVPELGLGRSSAPVLYYLTFIFSEDRPRVVNNHIPVDPDGLNDMTLRLSKRANKRSVVIGDLVQYTVTAENTGNVDLFGVSFSDTLPPGFSFVQGSARLSGSSQGFTIGNNGRVVNIDGVAIPAQETATLTYMARVGAGVTRGDYTNAITPTLNDRVIGNTATATVTLSADPDIEQTSVIGKVFMDRDGDGWQDQPAANQVTMKGGFASSSYVAGSTTIDRGDGPRRVPDNNGSPLLAGIELGDLPGRAGVAEGGPQIIVSQMLSEPAVTGDLTVGSREGTRLMLTESGEYIESHVGRRARSMTGQDIRVLRSMEKVNDQYRLRYTVSNEGVEEIGVPGVRLATAAGLIMETDAYGRYHLAGVDVANFARGRNFIIKLDPATLPDGARITTENPRVQRITQGLMNRLDFGVQLPEQTVPGKIMEIELGMLFFEKESAEIKDEYRPLLREMADELKAHDGGTLTIAGFAGTCKPHSIERKEYNFTPHFGVFKAVLVDADRSRLSKLVSEWLGVHLKDIQIDVIGHSDSMRILDSAQHIFANNHVLSKARADAVAKFLREALGLRDDQVMSLGKGPDEPVADNLTAEGRALNRRVEVHVWANFQGERECADDYDSQILAEERARAVLEALAPFLGDCACDVKVQVRDGEAPSASTGTRNPSSTGGEGP